MNNSAELGYHVQGFEVNVRIEFDFEICVYEIGFKRERIRNKRLDDGTRAVRETQKPRVEREEAVSRQKDTQAAGRGVRELVVGASLELSTSQAGRQASCSTCDSSASPPRASQSGVRQGRVGDLHLFLLPFPLGSSHPLKTHIQGKLCHIARMAASPMDDARA